MKTYIALLRGINVSGQKKIRMTDLARKLQKSKQSREHSVFDDKIIFLYYPDGYGRAVMNNNAFEKALQVEATTRNWKTVNKLYEMVYDH